MSVRQEFVIFHYAGPILYTCADFLEKNRDTFYENLQRVMEASTSPFVRAMFRVDGGGAADAAPDGTGGGGIVRERKRATLQVTIATRFKAEMASLMATIRSTHPRFVRCIKSNNQQLADVLESPCVLAQLNYAGVMAALEMRRAGYPTRMTFASFVRRYAGLMSFDRRRALASSMSGLSGGGEAGVGGGGAAGALGAFDCKREATALLASAAVRRVVNESRCAPARARGERSVHVPRGPRYAMGRTKVFLRANVLVAIDMLLVRSQRIAAARVQALVRGRLRRRAYLAGCVCVLRMQSFARGCAARRRTASMFAAVRLRRELVALCGTIGALGARCEASATQAGDEQLLGDAAVGGAVAAVAPAREAARVAVASGDLDRARGGVGGLRRAAEALDSAIAAVHARRARDAELRTQAGALLSSLHEAGAVVAARIERLGGGCADTPWALAAAAATDALATAEAARGVAGADVLLAAARRAAGAADTADKAVMAEEDKREGAARARSDSRLRMSQATSLLAQATEAASGIDSPAAAEALEAARASLAGAARSAASEQYPRALAAADAALAAAARVLATLAAEREAAAALARAREGAVATLDDLAARVALLRGRAVGPSAEYVDAAAAAVVYARRMVEGSAAATAVGPAIEEAHAALDAAVARVDSDATAAAAATVTATAAAARLAPGEADLRDVEARADEAGVAGGGAVAAALAEAARVCGAAHAWDDAGVLMPREAEQLSRAVDAAVAAVGDAHRVVDAAVAARDAERDVKGTLEVRARCRGEGASTVRAASCRLDTATWRPRGQRRARWRETRCSCAHRVSRRSRRTCAPRSPSPASSSVPARRSARTRRAMRWTARRASLCARRRTSARSTGRRWRVAPRVTLRACGCGW